MVARDSWARYGEAGHSAWRLLEADPPARPGAPAPITARVPARAQRAIVCAACAHPITTIEARISVLDAHEHRFMNPAGRLFRIGCFAEAAGCLVVGLPSDDYPWFPGFAWQVALCAACGDHLGWFFEARERGGALTFFGLRLDHLRVADESAPSG
jgi:hypothetical protein